MKTIIGIYILGNLINTGLFVWEWKLGNLIGISLPVRITTIPVLMTVGSIPLVAHLIALIWVKISKTKNNATDEDI